MGPGLQFADVSFVVMILPVELKILVCFCLTGTICGEAAAASFASTALVGGDDRTCSLVGG